MPRRTRIPWFFVAAPEIGTPEHVRLVKAARTVDDARRLDEHRDVANHPDANRSDVFVLCPYNVAFQPRRLMIAPADDGCKRLLGGSRLPVLTHDVAPCRRITSAIRAFLEAAPSCRANQLSVPGSMFAPPAISVSMVGT